jgi:hypothetical protein
MIQLCLAYLILLNVSGEDSTKKLWDKLGSLYQSKYLVNKLFLRKKLYLLWMSEGISVIEHLNVFNTIISYLLWILKSRRRNVLAYYVIFQTLGID